MDPNGGIRPSTPRLDNAVPQQPQPVQAAMPQAVPVAPAITTPSLELAPEPTFAPLPSDIASAPVTPVKTGKGKKIALVLVGLLVVLGIAAGAYFAGFTMGKTKGRTDADAAYQKSQAQQQSDSAAADTSADTATDTTAEDAATAKLDLSALQDPKYEDEALTGTVGKQSVANDGFVLKVTNIERNFKSTDASYKLDASKELIKVNFLMGNVAKDKSKDISNFNFRLENSASARLTPENIATYTDKFDTVKLDPGSQAKGSIVYAVNKDEKPLKFVREQRYRITGQNKEVTTSISVVVAQ